MKQKLDTMTRYATITLSCDQSEEFRQFDTGHRHAVMVGLWTGYAVFYINTATGYATQETHANSYNIEEVIDDLWTEFSKLYPDVVERQTR